MCNEAARRTALNLIRDDFRKVRIELTFPEGLPNLAPLDSIRITDPAAIVRLRGAAHELVQRRWSWVGPGSGKGAGKPVYNFRSEGRSFTNTNTGGRCLIPLDGFYEFTDAEPLPGEPKPKRKDKWLFTMPPEPDGDHGAEPDGDHGAEPDGDHGAEPDGDHASGPDAADPDSRPLFCVAGLWRAGVSLGKDGTGEAWTMLTCDPGPDIAPYHSRQIVLMPREHWADWLGGTVPAADLIAPTPAGTLRVVPAR
ncbi:SOS response-associated peptidase family protein [Sphingosinicellaceae bacterium]|nr:SOS response-associated peptidase family protein [Sphingosinicellaceae bacterium]